MKKVFFALALVATVLASCNKVTTIILPVTYSPLAVVDSVQVDSIQVDSTIVSDDEARDYLKDAIK